MRLRRFLSVFWCVCMLVSVPCYADAAQGGGEGVSNASKLSTATTAQTVGSMQSAKPEENAQTQNLVWPLAELMDYLPDQDATLSIQDVSGASQRMAFKTAPAGRLPLFSGVMWLRFSFPADRQALFLDLGDDIPKGFKVYSTFMRADKLEIQEITPNSGLYFALPAVAEARTLYVRLEGSPSLWFAPVLRSPASAVNDLQRLVRPAIMVALVVVMLLCFLRGASTGGQWRLWTGAFTAAVFLSMYGGVPATPHGSVPFNALLEVMAPGLALMLLPHVARHFLRTRVHSKKIDTQYMLLSLLGAVLALIPAVPTMAWTIPLLCLWPLLLLFFLPTTVLACIRRLAGARRFLLGISLPLCASGVSLLAVGEPLPDPLLASAPFWGAALGALVISGTGGTPELEKDEVIPRIRNITPPREDLADPLPEEPGLRLISPAVVMQEQQGVDISENNYDRKSDMEQYIRRSWQKAVELLQPGLDILARESAALRACALPPAAREHVDTLAAECKRLAVLLDAPQSRDVPENVPESNEEVFTLYRVIRKVHDSIAEDAEKKGLALSWFVAPHLPQRFFGHLVQLERVLHELAASAVRATAHGAVQISVRRMPESVEPGYLLFSVTDSGMGVPPLNRNAQALALAWEFAGEHQGTLSIDSTAQGTSVSFSARLGMLVAEDHAQTAPLQTAQLPLRILLVDELSNSRELLAYFLEGLPHEVREARSATEAADFYAEQAAGLLVLNADMPLDEIIEALARIRNHESEYVKPHVPVIALTSDTDQWETLQKAGCTHELPKPVTRRGLRALVLDILPVPGTAQTADTNASDEFAFAGHQDLEQLSQPVQCSQEERDRCTLHTQQIMDTLHTFSDTEFSEGSAEMFSLRENVQNPEQAVQDSPVIEADETLDSFVPSRLDARVQDILAANRSLFPDTALFDEAGVLPAEAPAEEIASTLNFAALDMPDLQNPDSDRSEPVAVLPDPVETESAMPKSSVPEAEQECVELKQEWISPEPASEPPVEPESAQDTESTLTQDWEPLCLHPAPQLMPVESNAPGLVTLMETEVQEAPPEEEDAGGVAVNPVSVAALEVHESVQSPEPLSVIAPLPVQTDLSALFASDVPPAKVENRAEPRSALAQMAAAADSFIEWVGEPMPIVRKPETAEAESAADAAADVPVRPATGTVREILEKRRLAEKRELEAQKELKAQRDTAERDRQEQLRRAQEQARQAQAEQAAREQTIKAATSGQEMDDRRAEGSRSLFAQFDLSGSTAQQPDTPEEERELVRLPSAAARNANAQLSVASQILQSLEYPQPQEKKAVRTLSASMPRKSGKSLLDFILPRKAEKQPAAAPKFEDSRQAQSTIQRTPSSEQSFMPGAPSRTEDIQMAENFSPLELHEKTANRSLAHALDEARIAKRTNDAQNVGRAAAHLAEQAEAQGLRKLGRLARCVERAAEANDHDAIADILPELEHAVERHLKELGG